MAIVILDAFIGVSIWAIVIGLPIGFVLHVLFGPGLSRDQAIANNGVEPDAATEVAPTTKHTGAIRDSDRATAIKVVAEPMQENPWDGCSYRQLRKACQGVIKGYSRMSSAGMAEALLKAGRVPQTV
ncbi:MAG: hypothetical protein AAF810_04980 [Cyanobacteria bacterium P01_D01_bin.36]